MLCKFVLVKNLVVNFTALLYNMIVYCLGRKCSYFMVYGTSMEKLSRWTKQVGDKMPW